MYNIQIQPGLKAKLWLIILVNKKKLNRVMLNGEGNENGIKFNRSNQQKNKLHVQHVFLVFPLPLLCTTTTLFCTTKTSNFLVTHYFYGGIVVCAYPIFCFLCSCSLLFFTPLFFTLLVASISHCLTAALNFHVFLPTKFVSFVFNLSLQLLCSVA